MIFVASLLRGPPNVLSICFEKILYREVTFESRSESSRYKIKDEKVLSPLLNMSMRHLTVHRAQFEVNALGPFVTRLLLYSSSNKNYR